MSGLGEIMGLFTAIAAVQFDLDGGDGIVLIIALLIVGSVCRFIGAIFGEVIGGFLFLFFNGGDNLAAAY